MTSSMLRAFSATVALLGAFFAFAACVAPRVRTDTALGHELTASWVSSMLIESDTDGLELEPDFTEGEGWSARGSIGAIGDQTIGGEFGVTFVRTEHFDRWTGADVDFYLAHMDLLARGRIGWEWFAIRPGAGVGGGVALLDFDRDYGDDGGLTGSVIGLLGVELFGHALFELRAEAFRLGYPGETIADGSYLSVGGGLRF